MALNICDVGVLPLLPPRQQPTHNANLDLGAGMFETLWVTKGAVHSLPRSKRCPIIIFGEQSPVRDGTAFIACQLTIFANSSFLRRISPELSL